MFLKTVTPSHLSGALFGIWDKDMVHTKKVEHYKGSGWDLDVNQLYSPYK